MERASYNTATPWLQNPNWQASLGKAQSPKLLLLLIAFFFFFLIHKISHQLCPLEGRGCQLVCLPA